MATLVDVARLALGLPGAAEGERYGHRTWFVGKKAFAWERPFSKADLKRFGAATPPAGPIVAVAVEDLAEKEVVLADSSDAVFTIPHFDGYAAVLVQLDRVTDEELTEMVVSGWLACAPADAAEAYLADRRPDPSA